MTSKIGVSWTQSLAFLFLRIFNSFEMAVLLKGCKPYNFEPYNSLKHNFKNIRSLRSKFVVYESFPASNSPEILGLCETKLDDSIYFCNFSLSVCMCVCVCVFVMCVCVCMFVWHLSFIQKDSVTPMHSLPVYLREGLPFARDLSLWKFADSYLCFRLALLHSVSYFFFLYRSPSSSLCTVFDAISSNIDDVLLTNLMW